MEPDDFLVEEPVAEGRVPRHLYKYLSLESDEHVGRVIDILNGSLYAATRDQFNDPFDCDPIVRVNLTAREREQHLKHLVDKFNRGASRMERRHIYTKFKGRMAGGAFEATAKRSVDGSLAKARVACLTIKPDDLLMWGHYAVNHRGCCLQLDFADLLALRESGNVPLPVQYTDERPTFIYPIEAANKCIETAFLTKASCWSYEKEWRLLEQHGRASLKFGSRLVRAIIFGARTPSERIAQLRERLDAHPIPVYRAELDADAYKIDVRRTD